LAQAGYRTLAQKLQQDANVTFPPVLVTMLDGLEAELRCGEISAANQQWLAQCGLTAEQMARQLEQVYTPLRKLHLYHCDHRGLPLALICHDGRVAWQAEYDEWGDVLREDNPDGLEQLLRLPGQQYDAETGLCYNRHRYYDPAQGRYITQDPIGLAGGWNPYIYPMNPATEIDPLGLINIGKDIKGASGVTSVHANPGPEATSFRPDHSPNHIHLGKNDGPRVSTDDWKPLSQADAAKMSKEQNAFCKKITDDAKKLLSERQRQVFRYGRLLGILGDYFSVRDVAGEMCQRGDLISCQIYENMGGDLTPPAI
ncbi:RHS repeat protein, partial [Enterobacter cloacae complex sp. P15RS]|uniref:RHS repeat-associated core domain-containing protein n=1 Tax=Enterobacter cloacae complex sp. P15RS TaxID=2779578 RepID=UPI001869270C